MARSPLTRCIYLLIVLCCHQPGYLVVGMLSGSCIDAGYTECCSDNCYASPDFCSCDPRCEVFGDCCQDIYMLCNPAVERAHNAYRPSVVYLENITFHTVAIHWIVTPGPSEAINGTYRVTVYRGGDASNYSTALEDTIRSRVYSLPISINATEADRLGRTFHVSLVDLEQDTSYTYKIGIVSDVKTIENVQGGSFRTAKYPSVEENVTLDLTEDPSSVLLTWVNTEVPSGVNIVHYKVKYAEKTEEEQVGVVHTSSPEEVSLTVNELRTHQKYVFHVSVVVEETDGSLYEFGGSANGLEIYVPDMSDFQLVAKSSISCVSWNMAVERQVARSLRSELLNLLHDSCPATFPGENLRNEAVIPLCENDSVLHVTYRANLISVEGCSSRDLVNSVNEWRLRGEHPVSADGVTFQFSHSASCPTLIDHHDVPLCITVAESPTCATAEHVAESASQQGSVSTTMLITYLLVEFGFLTALYAVIAIGAVCIIRMWKKTSKDINHKSLDNNYTIPSKAHTEIDINSLSSTEDGNTKISRNHIRSETDDSDLELGQVSYVL